MNIEKSNFIKDFSKKESPEERSRLAQEIREKRTNYFNEKNNIEEKEQEKSEIVKQIEALRDQIEGYNSASFFVKIKDFFAIKKIEGELQSQLGKQSSIEDALSQSISGRQDLEETRKMVADFYTKEKKKWAELPYSKEDIKKYFTEEHLASLPMEDYVTLLQRFPGEMVTHVTRQGIRDHVHMYEHTAGMGESHNGFKNIIESKRLLSPIAAKLSKAESYHDICRLLSNEDIVTNRDALKDWNKQPTDPRKLIDKLKRLTGGNINKDFHDASAIHVAVEEVLDAIYGGERGNEIFIAVPAAHIASQYNFINSGKGAFSKSESGKNNDLYIWTENEKLGINIDAGIVFIPKDAQVDRETGSQFELDDSGNPTEIEQEKNEKNINTLAYKKSEKTITSQEYWENYFSQHPATRPLKVVYYDENLTPTEALLKWKVENGIIKKGDETTLDFNKEISNDFKRPGGDEALLHFHRLALEALEAEYDPATILHCYDKEALTGSKEDLDNAYLKMWKAI